MRAIHQGFFIVLLWLGVVTAAPAAVVLPDAARFSSVIESGDLDKARTWLDAGLSPDFEGSPIGTGIMIGAWSGNIAMMALFHERGADLNRANQHGEQAVLHAAWRGQAEAVRWLLARGANLNREGWQWSALHYAAFAGHGELVEELLSLGADVNARSTNGSTPLMMAAREGREGIAARLLLAGADPALRNEWDLDAREMAGRANNLRILRLIEASDPDLVKRPPAKAPPLPRLRSQPVPDAADMFLAKARLLEAEGKRAEALAAYRAALAEIRKTEARKPAGQAKQVTGVRIQAKRTAPAEQRTEIQVAPATSVPQAGAQKVGAGGTGQNAGKGTLGAPDGTAVDDLLARAREAEASGRRKEALELFRQAATLLRQQR